MILACTATIFFNNFITEAINIVHWNWPSQLNSPVFCSVSIFERDFEWANTSHFELWKSWIPGCEICKSTDYISQVIQFLWNVIFAKCRSWNSNLFSAYLIDFLRGRIRVKGSDISYIIYDMGHIIGLLLQKNLNEEKVLINWISFFEYFKSQTQFE